MALAEEKLRHGPQLMQRLGHNQNLLHTAEYLRQSFCLAAALEALRLSSSVRWLRGLRCAGLSYNRTARHRSADGALCIAERVPLVEVGPHHPRRPGWPT